MLKVNIDDLRSVIFADAKNDNFSGYDPFDGLNSKLLKFLPKLKNNIFGLIWIQFFKRFPINIRPLLCVPKSRNPKGVGLFVLGLLEEYKYTNKACYLEQAVELSDWLLTQQCSKVIWGGSCWGYHFDWKARAFFVPKGKPNAITTVYVARALFSLAEKLECQGLSDQASLYRDPALNSADFIVNSLYSEVDGRCFFAYVPNEKAFVHNASLWAAAWVAIVAKHTGRSEYRLLSLKVASQSISEQHNDGSWVYGARDHHQFIDSFHTGYNLEALNLIRRSLDVNEFDDAIKKGFGYYKLFFFDENNTAKYYNNNLYPLDMHSVAQAILTITLLAGEDGDSKSDLILVENIIDRAIDTLYIESKRRFVYQKNKYFTNSINYIRWTQGWVYYSFSFFLNRLEKKDAE